MCSFALKFFSDNLDQYMLEFPIVSLVISSIRCSSSDEQKKQIVNNFMRNPKRWLTKKYHKRVLAACLNVSSKEVLDMIVPGLLMNRRAVDFLANRSLYYILAATIESNHSVLMYEIIAAVKYDLSAVLQSKMFIIFITDVSKTSSLE